MQIAEMVNIQMVVPNAANANVPAEVEGESFCDALNSVSAVTEVSASGADVEKSLGREIEEVVQKILSGKMRPEAVPKKYLCFNEVKAAIKAVLKLWNMTEDEMEKLLLTAVSPDGAKMEKSEELIEKKDDEKPAIAFDRASVPMNLSDCVAELAAVKNGTAMSGASEDSAVTSEATTVITEVQAVETDKTAETEQLPESAVKTPQHTVNPFVNASQSKTNEATAQHPKQNEAVSELDESVPQNDVSAEQSEIITKIGGHEAVIEAAQPIDKPTTEAIPANANGAEMMKSSQIESLQQESPAGQQSGEKRNNMDFSKSNVETTEVKAFTESTKSDFGITRFEAVSRASEPTIKAESAHIELTQNVRKPQIVKTTELEELVVPKQAKADGAELTAEQLLQPQQTVKLNISGNEIAVKPSEVLKQVTQSITEKVHTALKQEEYTVELEPAQLGKITIRLIKESGKISVSITAENRQTEALLADKGQFIREAVRENGVQLESWQVVSQSNREHMAQDYNGSSKNPYYREDNENDSDNESDESFADLLASM